MICREYKNLNKNFIQERLCKISLTVLLHFSTMAITFEFIIFIKLNLLTKRPKGGNVIKKYETMLLFKAESEIYQKALEVVRQKIKDMGGSVEKETTIGDQALAYPIAKQKKGHYSLMIFSLDAAKLKELDADLKMVDGLLRYLITAIK